MGCGAVTANFPLFAGSRPALTLRGARYALRPVVSTEGGRASRGVIARDVRPFHPGLSPPGRYDLGRRKLGAVLGDHCQLGCGSVTEPGCFLAPNTHAYPLSRLPRGVYGPRELLKSRPRMERAALR